ILSNDPTKANIVVGNPPWRNFNDLPPGYKETLKPYYFRYHLIANSRELLLGSSRIDIAALVVAKCLIENLKENGVAYFFMPLSILLNDSAHRPFRAYRLGEIDFAVNRVYDFKNNSIFEGVATRYGLVEFQRNKKPVFPIPYHVFESGQWAKKLAKPAFHSDDPFSIEESCSFDAFEAFSKIEVPSESKPRQGVNTCGANQVFIFDSVVRLDAKTARVSNKINKGINLPLKYLFPLVTKNNFGPAGLVAQRFVLLPYDAATGKPLEEEEIKKEDSLHKYLLSQKPLLENRRGTLLKGWISKGYWWALLGVGKYSFSPYKIIWEAFGKGTYAPKIFSGKERMCWQGNQALHAYIPTVDRKSAVAILKQLKNPVIQLYLSSQRMEGTCNWAQPGRICKLLNIKEAARSPRTPVNLVLIH
ncbi:MAG: SAM-dependent DNA methyltransferase, partial [Bacteroidota bacterium]